MGFIEMRILYLHQYFNTRESAGGTRSYEFSRLWIKNGHSVDIITSDGFIQDDLKTDQVIEQNIDGINVTAIPVSYSNYMSSFKRIKSFLSFMYKSTKIGLKKKDYDVIYATSTPLTIAITALIISKIKKKPFVFEVRDLWPEAPVQMGIIKSKIVIFMLKKLEFYTYKKAKHVISLSPGMQEGVLEAALPIEKSTVVPNCSDLELFKKANDESSLHSQLSARLDGKFVAIHAGSMGEANGLDYIVKAAKKLKDWNQNDIIIILTGDGMTRPRLEKYCEDNNLNNVLFTGEISKKDMPNMISKANITITSFKNLPILATNSPNKFFDSLAASKPVIVNSNGWTKNIVEEEEIGFYVNPETPEELAKLLTKLVHKKENLKEMGLKARKVAERDFDRVKLATKVEKILQNVIDNTKMNVN